MTRRNSSSAVRLTAAILIGVACGTPSAPLEDVCSAICSNMCAPIEPGTEPPDVEGCTDACVGEHADARKISAECGGAHRDFYTCISELSCDEGLEQTMDPENGPCGDKWSILLSTCESLFSPQKG